MDNIKLLKMLYGKLRERESFYFLPYRYKWILGIEVYKEVRAQSYEWNTKPYDPEEIETLFDIEVEIDYRNPKRVSIWKDITDDL